MQFVSRAAFFCLWCFVLVLPWDVFKTLPVAGSIPRLVGLVASAVGIVYILARRRIRPLSWFHVFAVLFALWAGVSSFWSMDPWATRTLFITYLQLTVLVWLIWEIAWSPVRRRALLQAYVLGACVAAVTTIHQSLSGVSIVAGAARFAALNQNPNELGMTLALGLPMAWCLGLTQPQRRIGWIWRLYLPLGITGILLTASRGAFLAGLVALVIVPWTQGRLRLRTKVALYACAVATLVLATSVVPEAALERIKSTRADIEAGHFGGRGAIWVAGVQVAREHPLVGVGAGAFEVAVVPTLRREQNSHQVFLTILVEQGLVGLLLFLAMAAAAMTPLRHLPLFQQRLWIVLLATLVVGSMSADLSHRKQFWFVLGLLAAQVASRPARMTSSPATRTSFAPELPVSLSTTSS